MGSSAATSSATAAATLPDAWRVELFRKSAADDPDGAHLPAAARELGITGLERARLGRGFLLPPALSAEDVARITRELLADPVLDDVRTTPPEQEPHVGAGARVLVARKPGVMDPVALTIERALRKAELVPAGVDVFVSTFHAWELEGALGGAELAELASRVLANDTIESVTLGGEGLHYGRPAPAKLHGRVEVPLLAADDATLLDISQRGALSLNLVEMKAIQAHYAAQGREPSACELETLAQTWSEHCKHKTFAGIVDMDGRRIDNLLKSTIKRATDELDRDWCVSVFHDNAGIIRFDGDWDVCFKVETHNHPSAIDPYGGAGTGIGGVIRDILGVGLGAKPIANTDAFFVGPSDLASEALPKGCMHPRRILRGVVAGVRDYGNRMGIPTVSGGVWFEEGYVANPLVYAGTVGLMPRWAAHKEVHPGDAILVVGGRTGRDGIHGATFSSAELHEESEMVSSAAVQIGDPITEKRVLDGLLRARDLRLYRAVTDCGAGGLSSAVGEMGETCGAEVDLELVPLKYPGLTPEEIWISEAQERMVLAVPPEHLEACMAVFAAEEVEATCIGRFTDSGRLVLRYAGEVVGDMEMAFLHDGTPRPVRRASWTAPDLADPGAPRCDDVARTVLALVGTPNVASKEWIVRQYDHEVQGMSVLKANVGVKSDAPGDGAVLRPLEDSLKGVAITCGANPRYGLLHPGRMALAVIDEALRNAVAVGGDPDHTAILDNFSWGNCDKPDRLGALVLAAEACRDAALAYGTPFISGKDSLNNEYRVGDRSIAIPPTLLISALSIVPDVRRAVSMDAKRAGDLVYVVGLTRAELGGSEHHRVRGLAGGVVPAPDLAAAPALLRALHRAIAGGYVQACHDLSEGGLAVAAAEMAFAGGLGLDVDLARVPATPFPSGYDADTTALFSESCTRFLVEVAPEHQAEFEARLDGLPLGLVGRVRADKVLELRGAGGDVLARLDLGDLRAAHLSSFQG
ncbi:MAG: phosphoribosylformylglycinamidine synthase subunit PurL [Planctomycetes bacterium]|nr:phosphoribosylformylglycinamidine synthase subunit PurL [Planctomycetota bacterium]